MYTTQRKNTTSGNTGNIFLQLVRQHCRTTSWNTLLRASPRLWPTRPAAKYSVASWGNMLPKVDSRGTYHLHGKTVNSSWKIKWFVPFHLGSFWKYGLWFEVMLFSALLSLSRWCGYTLQQFLLLQRGIQLFNVFAWNFQPDGFSL